MGARIYSIKNLINNKIYIGMSVNVEERWSRHKTLFKKGGGLEANKPLYLAFQKYGIENFAFDIIEKCSPEELSEKEKYYIKKYDCCILDGYDKGYNLTRGGEGYLTNDYELIYSLWKDGMDQKDIANKLKTDEKTIIRALNSFDVNHFTRRSRAMKKASAKRRRPVVQYDKNMVYIAEYESISKASKDNQIDASDIGKVCKGKKRSAGGYVWKYKEEKI